ncbi:nitrate- and nitrite sensing domain-containing protein [Kitasatospora sp. NPDC006697]|uniref:sensor histidine kinase n=1 Tax=Kitasatospora sp. NPDC006697 TaxID=3364020 RepID=UPI0036CCB946
MRLRRSSIRAKIIALLLVPIVALVALWAYATMVTTGDFWQQLKVASTYRTFGTPVDQVARDLQQERRTAVIRLARPGASGVQDDYLKAQQTTDSDVLLLEQRAAGPDRGKLNGDERAKLQAMVQALGTLQALRGQVGQSTITWEFASTRYSDLIRPSFEFRSAFVTQQSGQIPRQGTVLIELARAREYLSQEDAAMAGLLATDQPSFPDYQAVLDPMHNQQALFTVYLAELDEPDRSDYQALRGGSDWQLLDLAEREFQSANSPSDVRQTVSEARWTSTAATVLGDQAAENDKLVGALGSRATSYAMGLLWRGLIAGAVGLLAIVATVLISLRIGRGLVRELVGLRNAANELAGARLPSLMRRLRDGEPVDIAHEVLELDFGDAEIGQVGRAFNEVQRTAVEAAVEQAELRRGVSAVFVNLARRSQVLLHRQLTLLDTMERRTEDPGELEDLFKLDHLTTRMRRHAEGLIILSGGSPGRAWRKPVRMVDVVRAAVGEVEDYARVIVRPFPGTGLLGSAVADVTHLIAELVENAAVFSPPQTQVTVQGEVVAHGFALEIDDRGLGLSEQALAEINERLDVEQPFDLADTDRLGLFVVSRLARRHGIKVSLRASPYGGTTAVVLIPRELLAEVPGQQQTPAPAAPGVEPPKERELVAVAGGAPAGGPRRVRPRGPQRQVTGPQPAGAEPARSPGGLPRRRAAGGPVLVPSTGSGGTGRHRRAETPAESGPVLVPEPADVPEPAAAPERAASAPPEPAAAQRPAAGLLPRRVKQANLAPQLRGERTERERPEPVAERSPEEARAAFSSFQRGFSRGRAEPDRPAPRAPAPVVRAAPFPDHSRRAITPPPVPPALPASPQPAPPAEGPDR